MAYNGSGTFNRVHNWVTDLGNSVAVTASRMDAEQDGIATGLSTAITKDGQTTVTANIPMNSKKFTGLTVGSARTDSISLGQVQDNTYGNLGASSGTDAYTATPSPVLTAYTASQRFTVEIGNDNTGAATLNINAVGAEALEKYDGAGALTALEAGDVQAGQKYDVIRNQANAKFVVLNPQRPALAAASETAEGVIELATAAEVAIGTDATRAVTAANQGWVKISTATASSSATIEFTDLSSTYSTYKVFVHTLVPATDNTIFYLRTSTDNGSSFDSGSSDYQHRRAIQNTTTWGQSGVVGDTEIQIVGAVGSGTNEYLDVEITIHTPSSAKFTSVNWIGGLLDAVPGHAGLIGQGCRLAATDVDAIQFLMSSGNIASGKFTLYGLKA